MLNFLKKNIVTAGEMCLQGVKNESNSNVSFKGRKDLVTIVDQRVEQFLVNQINKHFPGHDIVGEEGGEQKKGSRHCWYIDPIDGTTSYFHGQPYYSVSVALKRDNDFILAGVYAPALGQLFLAAKGKGATLNGESIKMSGCSDLESAVLATGFACLRAGLEKNNLANFTKIVPKIRDVRRCGSAAVDLAYVAAGKIDGFWELNLNIYDVAAGILLVNEAGGKICDFRGGSDYPSRGIVAATSPLIDKLLPLLEDQC